GAGWAEGGDGGGRGRAGGGGAVGVASGDGDLERGADVAEPERVAGCDGGEDGGAVVAAGVAALPVVAVALRLGARPGAGLRSQGLALLGRARDRGWDAVARRVGDGRDDRGRRACGGG